MKHTGKYEATVTSLLENTDTREWTSVQLDLLNVASTVDSLVRDIVDINERLAKQLTDITKEAEGSYTYVSPLHASRTVELTEKVAKINAFRECLYIMVGMVLGPDAQRQFISNLY